MRGGWRGRIRRVKQKWFKDVTSRGCMTLVGHFGLTTRNLLDVTVVLNCPFKASLEIIALD